MAEPDYRFESHRLSSFTRYPDGATFQPPELSRRGFYSTGQGVEVMCYGCGVGHANFQIGQSIRRAHMQMSPDCPLNGATLQADDAIEVLNAVPQDHPAPFSNQIRPVDDDDDDPNSFPYYSLELQAKIKFNRSEPNFELLRLEGSRLRRFTFFDWPEEYGDKEQLASRGFFYTGIKDKVRCSVRGITYKAAVLQDQTVPREDWSFDSCWSHFH